MAGKKTGPKSSYKSEYCDLVIERMAEGKTKSQVCKELGINRKTFYRWRDKYPEFAEAIKEGEFQAEAWWTEQGRLATIGKLQGFNATPWIFNMKNQFGWRDKQDVAIDGNLKITEVKRVIVDPNDTNS